MYEYSYIEAAMSSSEMEKIGQQLRQARKQRGFSQEEVAAKLSMRRATVSDIERGVYKGVLPPLLKYLNFLGLTLEVEKIATELPLLLDFNALFSRDNT